MLLKKFLYHLAVITAGGLSGFLLHALIELWYIPRLLNNYALWGWGLSWNQWFMIHELFVITLTIGGALWGARQAGRWWQYIYVNKHRSGIFLDHH